MKSHWDPRKASSNRRKHGVNFEWATEVLLDPLAITIADLEHSVEEARWITIGRVTTGQVLVVVHTFEEIHSSLARVRLISAREATRTERLSYEEQA